MNVIWMITVGKKGRISLSYEYIETYEREKWSKQKKYKQIGTRTVCLYFISAEQNSITLYSVL